MKISKKISFFVCLFRRLNVDNIDPDKVVINLSKRVLSAQEKSILARGLNFSIPPRKLDYVDFLVSFELLHNKVCNETSNWSIIHKDNWKEN